MDVIFRKNSKYILLWMLLYVNTIYAGAHPVASIGLGGTNTINLTQKTTFPIYNPRVDEFYTYTPSDQNLTQGLIEAFLGAEFQIPSPWLVQIGFAYTQTALLKPSGTLLQGADFQSSDLYQYNYDVSLHQVMLQGKLMRNMQEKFFPYFLAGIGIGINTAENFSTSAPINQTFTRIYADNTQTSFAFRLGLGIDVNLHKNLRLGLAYRISDVGSIELGNADIDSTPVSGTLSQDYVFSNEILLNLTYIFA